MTDNNPPKIELPQSDYPIKVMGEASDDFREQVLAVLEDLGVQVEHDEIRKADSRNARYVSLTIPILAESEEQLSELNTRLRELPAVKMVL